MLGRLFCALHQKIGILSKEEQEYIQYTQDLDRVLTNLESLLHDSNDPEEIVSHALMTACEFYGGDWAGFVEVDMELGLWSPYMWYNSNSDDKTMEFLNEYESSEFLVRWVKALKENQPIIVPDCTQVRSDYPHESEMYQRLGMKSVVAVSVKPFPTGFLVYQLFRSCLVHCWLYKRCILIICTPAPFLPIIVPSRRLKFRNTDFLTN